MSLFGQLGVAPLVILVLATLSILLWRRTLYHFRAVERGRLYRSGELGPIGLWLIWRLYGVRTILNLTSEQDFGCQERYQREERFCRQRGIALVRLRMLPGVEPNPSQIRRFLEIIRNDANQPVLVHCTQGVERTNMMVAVYLKERFAAPNRDILQALPSFGHRINTHKYSTMRGFILEYKPEEDGDRIIPEIGRPARGHCINAVQCGLDPGESAGELTLAVPAGPNPASRAVHDAARVYHEGHPPAWHS